MSRKIWGRRKRTKHKAGSGGHTMSAMWPSIVKPNPERAGPRLVISHIFSRLILQQVLEGRTLINKRWKVVTSTYYLKKTEPSFRLPHAHIRVHSSHAWPKTIPTKQPTSLSPYPPAVFEYQHLLFTFCLFFHDPPSISLSATLSLAQWRHNPSRPRARR